MKKAGHVSPYRPGYSRSKGSLTLALSLSLSLCEDLALLSISALISNTCSMIQQGHDITWYTDIVTEQYVRKQKLPGSDPELAIAGGSFGLDLVLYYIRMAAIFLVGKSKCTDLVC